MKVLNIVKNVLDEFNKNNIKYCHFKSNEHVDAAVIGDTIGDPFKDTAGPAMNPLIKVAGTISLIIAPFLLF